MKRTPVISAKAPSAVGPYSQAIAAGNMVFVSGQIALGMGSALVAEDVAGQTEQCLRNVGMVLAASRLTMNHVVKVTIYMTDLGQFAAMNEVYARHFRAPFPARATVQVSALPKGALVEIDAVAMRP